MSLPAEVNHRFLTNQNARTILSYFIKGNELERGKLLTFSLFHGFVNKKLFFIKYLFTKEGLVLGRSHTLLQLNPPGSNLP